MKLEEAIEILSDNVRAKPPGCNADYFDAIKLGIEALKTYQDVRKFLAQLPSGLLPGETKEVQ